MTSPLVGKDERDGAGRRWKGRRGLGLARLRPAGDIECRWHGMKERDEFGTARAFFARRTCCCLKDKIPAQTGHIGTL